MDVDARVDELFALPLDRFTDMRNKLVSELKKSDPEAAARIRALRKPTSAVWAINQLAHRHGPELEELVRLHEQMTSIKGAEDLRTASRERKRVVGRLTDLAMEELVSSGHRAGSATSQKISQTLIAAASGEELEALRWGRLTQEIESPGFQALEGFEAAGDSAIYDRSDRRAEERLEGLKKHAEEAAKTADDLGRRAEKARMEADRLTAQAEKARKQAESARSRLEAEQT